MCLLFNFSLCPSWLLTNHDNHICSIKVEKVSLVYRPQTDFWTNLPTCPEPRLYPAHASKGFSKPALQPPRAPGNPLTSSAPRRKQQQGTAVTPRGPTRRPMVQKPAPKPPTATSENPQLSCPDVSGAQSCISGTCTVLGRSRTPPGVCIPRHPLESAHCCPRGEGEWGPRLAREVPGYGRQPEVNEAPLGQLGRDNISLKSHQVQSTRERTGAAFRGLGTPQTSAILYSWATDYQHAGSFRVIERHKVPITMERIFRE